MTKITVKFTIQVSTGMLIMSDKEPADMLNMTEKPFPPSLPRSLPRSLAPSRAPALPPSLVEAEGSYYIPQAELKVTILLPQPSECLDGRHVPPNPATAKL